ncbi:FAD/NAD(P)-binding oxidoreductase, partial [Alphaproteobacteria bacterium 46_93_T64]
VPTEHTKGIVVTRTIFGNVLVGPTAEDQESRSDASTDENALSSLLASASEIIPALGSVPVTAVYAGLRPATERKHYRIKARPDRNWITVGGIRSTGLSSAFGIARHVFGLYSEHGEKLNPIVQPKIPNVPWLAENGPRDWKCKGHGEIVCHCELVTEREIRNALTEPLAAKSLSGLKRQTRATMGRCQGFYCSTRLAELTQDHFDAPLSIGDDHV